MRADRRYSGAILKRPGRGPGADRHRLLTHGQHAQLGITRRPPRRRGGTLARVPLEAVTLPAGLRQYPRGVVIVDTRLRIIWVNQAAGRLGGGLAAAAWAGRRLGEVLPGLDIGPVERSLRRVLATGEAVDDLEVSSPGGERFWSCTQFRIDGPDGEAAGAAHVMREVTEQVRSQRRLALADEASARIGTTLDITRTAEELLDVAVPRLADTGAVDLLVTVIKGDQHAPQAHNQEMRFQQVALRWPADSPPPPAGME